MFGDNEVVFNFDDVGTSIITGQNGSGKSTIFSAIIWALYGMSSVNVENVVNRYTKKNCKVGVCFEVLNKTYTVYRYRRHETHGNNLYIFKGEENISLKKQADTEQLIQDIIQIPYKAMTSSIIFSFENYTSFLRAQSANRLKILESVLFLKEITDYYNITKDFVKDVDKKLEDASHEGEKVEYAREALMRTISDYKDKAKKTLEEFKAEKEEVENKIKVLKEEAKELANIDVQKELEYIRSYNDIIRYNNETNSQINSLRANITPELNSKLSNIKNKIFALSSINIEENLEIIKANKIKEDGNKEIENAILVLKEKIDPYDYTDDIRKVNKELEDVIKEIETIEKSVCPTCGHILDESQNKDILSSYILKREGIKRNLDGLVASKQKIDDNNSSINSQIEKLNGKKQQVVSIQYTEDSLRSVKDTVSALEKEAMVLENKVENEKNIFDHIKDLMEKIKEVPDMPKYTEKQLTDVNAIQDEITELEGQIHVINEKAKTVLDRKYIEDIVVKIKKLDTAKEKIEKNKTAILEEKRYLSVLMDVFSNKEAGFKKFFIDKIIAMFNANINFYLPVFFDKEINITFDKELNEKIVYDGHEAPFEGFSSGQKTRIDLAIAFSLFFLAKNFFSTTINLICLDEVTDQNLDNEGFEGVVSIIQNLSAEHAVYIISHRDEYKDKFNKHIKVFIDDNGFSSIRMNA